MNTELILKFVQAINTKNLQEMAELLTDDHTFNTAGKGSYKGIPESIATWKSLFDMYPDYQFEIENQVHHSNTIAVFGIASSKQTNMQANNDTALWSESVAWKILTEDEKIKFCQVYSSITKPSEKSQTPTDPNNIKDNTVHGFGGVFFKSKNPKALTAWYDTHLGTAFGSNTYHTFKWRERENSNKIGSTAFSIFTEKSTYFAPSEKPFMFNFRVQNLDAFLDKLIADGVKVDTKRDYTEYGNFGWIYDLEENKIEIWEAIDEVLEAYDSK